MNVILFGPPGIGKSTIIRELSGRGIKAIDLEHLWPDSSRFDIFKTAEFDGVIFGGADLDPKKAYPNTAKVLLVLPQDAYEARRANRDKAQPGKANQKQHLVSDWMKGVHYDVVFQVSGKVGKTADRLKTILAPYLKGKTKPLNKSTRTYLIEKGVSQKHGN